MESYAPNPDDMMNQNSSRIPSGMEQDPNADEEIIDQTTEAKAAENANLASSIAYALDGSGRNEEHLSSTPGPVETND